MRRTSLLITSAILGGFAAAALTACGIDGSGVAAPAAYHASDVIGSAAATAPTEWTTVPAPTTETSHGTSAGSGTAWANRIGCAVGCSRSHGTNAPPGSRKVRGRCRWTPYLTARSPTPTSTVVIG